MAPNNNVYPTWTWSTGIKDADGKDISVENLISKYNTLLNENKILREELESIEEDIEEYKKGNKNWMNLYQEVVDKNNELLKTNNRLTVDNNALLNKGGLKYMEAKLQIVQNGYDKCSRERDEFKHQLNAANKEIEALKKEKKESFEILKKAIEDESDRFNKLVSKSVDTEISLKKENEKINEYKASLESMKKAYEQEAKSSNRELEKRLELEKEYEVRLKELNNGLVDVTRENKKFCKIIEEQKAEIEKLKKDIIDYVFEKDDELEEAKETINALKNMKTQGFEDYDSRDFEEQKHPMYPIHWGGYDGAASAHPKEYKKWLYEQRDKAITESLAKEPSWEQTASDLALRVVKLERAVEELKLIKHHA